MQLVFWYHYTTALDEGYISKATYDTREKQYEKVLMLTNGYINFLNVPKIKMMTKNNLPNTQYLIPNT